MARNITAGIDVGTYATRVALSQWTPGEPGPKIIGTGMAKSRGMRRGYIVDAHLASESIKKALSQAEQAAGIRVRRATVAIGGVGLQAELGTGTAVISRTDGHITRLDIKKAIDECEQALTLLNKKILHIIPLQYKLDGKEILGKPEGMKGVKLEVKTLFITCMEQHFEELTNSVVEAGVDVTEVVASPLSSSIIALNDMQKTAGCLLVDIGEETVMASVFENGTLVSMHVFPLGSSDITKDIALAFQVSLEEAEGLKIGSIIPTFPKKKLDDVINARLTDMFELIDNYLKKIKRSGLLPAGIIIVGGGAHASQAHEIAREVLRLPSKIGTGEILTQTKNKMRDSSWFTAYGLCFREGSASVQDGESNSLTDFFSSIKKGFGNIIKQLLP